MAGLTRRNDAHEPDTTPHDPSRFYEETIIDEPRYEVAWERCTRFVRLAHDGRFELWTQRIPFRPVAGDCWERADGLSKAQLAKRKRLGRAVDTWSGPVRGMCRPATGLPTHACKNPPSYAVALGTALTIYPAHTREFERFIAANFDAWAGRVWRQDTT